MVVISCFPEIIQSFKFKFLWFPFSFPSQSISLSCTQRNAPFLWGGSFHPPNILWPSLSHHVYAAATWTVTWMGGRNTLVYFYFCHPQQALRLGSSLAGPVGMTALSLVPLTCSVSFLHWYPAEPTIQSRLFHCLENKFFSSATTSISLALLWLWTSGCTG